MSDPRTPAGPLTALATPIAESLAKHQAAPPDRKNANRAYMAGFLFGVCIYPAATLNPADYPDEYKLGFIAVCAWAGLLLVIGWRGSRGKRDPLGAVLAIAIPAGGFYAVAAYAPPELLQDARVQAFSCGIILANAVRVLICLRGPGSGSAEKQVRRQIAEQEISWQPVKRRR